MKSGNQKLDAALELNENILILDATMKQVLVKLTKIEENTKNL